MMHAPPADEHLDDGALVRLIDGEAADDERAGVEAHLAACPVCAARLGSLRRRSVNLGLLLARGDFAVPAPPSAPADEMAARREARRTSPPAASRAWLRAAAVVIGVGLFSSPVRAWFRDFLGGAGSGAPVAVQPAPAPAPVPVEGAQPASARVRFTTQGEEMAVEIAHPQAVGALVLSTAASSTATAEVRAPAGAPADLLVLPTGLRIANSAASVAEYHVAVPATVERVRVRVGTAPAITVPAAELGQGRRVELR